MKKTLIRKNKLVRLSLAAVGLIALLMIWPSGSIRAQELILEVPPDPPCCYIPPEPPPAAVASEINGFFLGVELRRQKGSGGYHDQSFLTSFSGELDGFGRFPTPDGNVGFISPGAPIPGTIIGGPLAGQVPLHRWSTQKGFYYSINYANYGAEYIYGGIAGYVWPPGDNRGFPLYQFFSQQYGHFYASYRNEINCKPQDVTWDSQGEMARVNFPAPLSQALLGQQCGTSLGPFPPSCSYVDADACRLQGRYSDFSVCLCL